MEYSTAYLGIDPGASGGIALIWEDEVDNQVFPIPQTEHEVWNYFSQLNQPGARAFAVIEKVSGYVDVKGREGAKHGGQPGSHMFTFGMSYGGLRMALLAAGFREDDMTSDRVFTAVQPKAWMNQTVPNRPKKISYSERKRLLRDEAKRLPFFPSERVTLKTCDAALLATYCKRIYGGTNAAD